MSVNHPLHIIVDTALNPGEAEYQNFGDVAMLQVAVSRLRRLWPDAIIQVLTESPDNLAKFCPEATALSRIGKNLWVSESFLFGRFINYLPANIATWLNKLTVICEERWPALLRNIVYLRLKIRDSDKIGRDLVNFLTSLEKADLIVICGGAFLADGNGKIDLLMLGLLETAIRRKIPTAMMGQGIGPLQDPVVLYRARNILPNVNIITLRGTQGGMQLLDSLGVSSTGLLTTGDEALELAYEARAEKIGNGVGVNLRVAWYAGIDKDYIGKLKPALQDFARTYHAPMIPIPIAVHQLASDHETIRQLMAGLDDQTDGGASLTTPVEVIHQVSRCRIVVTGAYHAAVFALSQGVPVVCLTQSAYYLVKFLGLQDQFGTGIEIINLDDSGLIENLFSAMSRAWNSADIIRNILLQSARRQVDLSKASYEELKKFKNHSF